MSLQELKEQAYKLSVSDRLALISAVIQSLQNTPSIENRQYLVLRPQPWRRQLYYSDDSSWSKGWLQLNPGSCGIAFPGRVSNSNIGVYAETFTGVVEAGDTRRCVI